jgi:hypothetical protein
VAEAQAQQEPEYPQVLLAVKAAQAVNSQRSLDTGNQQQVGLVAVVPEAVTLTVLLAKVTAVRAVEVQVPAAHMVQYITVALTPAAVVPDVSKVLVVAEMAGPESY